MATKRNNHVYIYIIAGIFLILVMMGIAFFKRALEAQQQSAPSVIKLIRHKEAAAPQLRPAVLGTDTSQPYLMLVSTSQEARVGETVVLTVIGNSQSQLVTGYDALIQVNPELADIVQIESADQRFDLFQSKSTLGMIYVTGARKDGIQSASLQGNIFYVTIRPKQIGHVSVSVISQQDQKKTKFVTNDLQVITPQTSAVDLAVK